MFRGASVLLVHPSFAVKSVPELISYAKTNPGKITMATAGVGSIPHMCGELFMATADVKVTQVHYRGAGPALIDMLGGQTQAIFATLPSSIQYKSFNQFDEENANRATDARINVGDRFSRQQSSFQSFPVTQIGFRCPSLHNDADGGICDAGSWLNLPCFGQRFRGSLYDHDGICGFAVLNSIL
jgi:hypothetical protein